jgi:hypothetical protein
MSARNRRFGSRDGCGVNSEWQSRQTEANTANQQRGFYREYSGGRIFIDKKKPGRKNEYVPILVPKETLERIRHRVKNGEPLQDFEGLLDFPSGNAAM